MADTPLNRSDMTPPAGKEWINDAAYLAEVGETCGECKKTVDRCLYYCSYCDVPICSSCRKLRRHDCVSDPSDYELEYWERD